MKLSQAISLFWLDKKLAFSPKTVTTYSYTYRYFVDFLKDKDIAAITKADVRAFLLHLDEDRKVSSRTLKDSLARVNSLLRWAEKELNVPFVAGGITVKYTENAINPFTEDEVKRLIGATDYAREWKARSGKRVQAQRPTALMDKAIILALLDTGVRVGELCAMQIQDFDQERGRILIKSAKNNKQRFVIVGNRTRKALARYLVTREKAKPADPLFASNQNTALDRNNVRAKLVRIGKQAGVTNVHPHRFRHTMAVQFLRNGGNLLMLQELLGHQKLEMVKHYAKLAELDFEQAKQHSVANGWRL